MKSFMNFFILAVLPSSLFVANSSEQKKIRMLRRITNKGSPECPFDHAEFSRGMENWLNLGSLLLYTRKMQKNKNILYIKRTPCRDGFTTEIIFNSAKSYRDYFDFSNKLVDPMKVDKKKYLVEYTVTKV